MNIDNLKSPWKRYVLENSMSSITENEILEIIDQDVKLKVRSKWHAILTNSLVFSFLLIFCQGG